MFTRRILIGLMLAIPSVAIAQDRGASKPEVIDNAAMFSASAIRDANESLARLNRVYGVTMAVETVNSLKGQGIEEVISRRAEQLDQKGLFMLISKEDRKFEVIATTRALREQLTKAQLVQIRDSVIDDFRKKQFDEGLARTIRTAGSVLDTLRPASASAPIPTPGGSSASTSGLVLRQQVRLNLAGAKKLVAGAEAKASDKGLKMSIAVVDDGGHLLAFSRMDGARPSGIAASTTKALAAATASGGPGSVAIVVDGQVIGAIGVSGTLVNDEDEVAKAALAAFLGELKDPTVIPGAPAAKGEGDGEKPR